MDIFAKQQWHCPPGSSRVNLKTKLIALSSTHFTTCTAICHCTSPGASRCTCCCRCRRQYSMPTTADTGKNGHLQRHLGPLEPGTCMLPPSGATAVQCSMTNTKHTAKCRSRHCIILHSLHNLHCCLWNCVGVHQHAQAATVHQSLPVPPRASTFQHRMYDGMHKPPD
jgi:hypothetical protein